MLIFTAAPSLLVIGAEEEIVFRNRAFKWVNPLPVDIQIPPGLTHQTFFSASMEQDVGYAIYLPPNYSDELAQRFPVVYYLHGGRPGNENRSLYLVPYIHEVISSGVVEPIIYVFINGGVLSHYNYESLESMGESLFVKELIPHIDSSYRTVSSRDGRAIQGFSQGGRGATRIMFKFPELFSSGAVGGGAYSVEKQIADSRGIEYDTRVKDPVEYDVGEGNDAFTLARQYSENNGPKLEIALWVGTEGFNYDSVVDYMKFLDSLNISYKTYSVGGVGHNANALYQSIGEELMKFHSNAFSIP